MLKARPLMKRKDHQVLLAELKSICLKICDSEARWRR